MLKFVICIVFCSLVFQAAGLKYLGKRGNLKSGVRESIYFTSDNPSHWNAADSVCKANLGPSAHLLCIEDDFELEEVYILINSSDDIYDALWTGGNCPTLNNWEWCGGPISTTLWGANEPRHGTLLSKAALKVPSGPYLQAGMQTEANGFICELEIDNSGTTTPSPPASTTGSPPISSPRPTPDPCSLDTDFVIVLESSTLMTDPGYIISKEYAETIVKTMGDNSGTRQGAAHYSTDSIALYGLLDGFSVDDMVDKLFAAPFLNGSISTHLAIEWAIGQITSNDRTARKAIVVITNGFSADPAATAAAAAKATQADIPTFAVSVWANTDAVELLAIAGGNPSHVFTVLQPNELLDLLQTKPGTCP